MSTKKPATGSHTLLDRMTTALKNHPVVAVLILLVTGAVGLSKGVDALRNTWSGIEDAAESDLMLDLSVTQVKAADDELVVELGPDLLYTGSRTGDVVNIRPEASYLARANKSRLPEIWCDGFIEMDPIPVLDVKLLNNSDRTIFITEARFIVQTSEAVRGAVPMIDQDDEIMNVPLCNVGWDDMKDVEIAFNVAPDSASPRSATYKYRMTVPDVETRALIDISAAIGAEGGDLNVLSSKRLSDGEDMVTLQLRDGRHLQLTAEQHTNMVIAALGPFYKPDEEMPDGPAIVYGVVSFSDGTNGGARRERAFEAKVPLYQWGAGGGYVEASAQYDVKLETTGRDYQRVVNVSHSMSPGSSDRLQFRVAADRSSRHHLRIELKYNDGKLIRSTDTMLELFVPRLPEWAQ